MHPRNDAHDDACLFGIVTRSSQPEDLHYVS